LPKSGVRDERSERQCESKEEKEKKNNKYSRRRLNFFEKMKYKIYNILKVVQDTKGSTEFGNGIVAVDRYGGGDGSQKSPYLTYNALLIKKLADDARYYYSNKMINI